MAVRWTILMLMLGSVLVGCAQDRCGRHGRYVEGICVCDEGYEPIAGDRCAKKANEDQGLKPDADAGADGMTEKPPLDGGCDPGTAYGCACASDADCAGHAADYCVLDDPSAPGDMRVCLIQGCVMDQDDCPRGLKCCGFFLAPKGTICLPEDMPCPLG